MGNQLACPGLEVSRRWRKSQLSWPNAWQQRVGSRVQEGPVGLGRGGQRVGVDLGDMEDRRIWQGHGGWWRTIKGPPSGSSNGPACGCDRLVWAGDLNYETKLPPRQALIWGLFESMSCLNSKLLGYGITVGALGEFKSLFSYLFCFHSWL